MAEKQNKATSDVKSGVKLDQFETILGGYPSKKSVEEIEKDNMPKDAPGSVRA